MTDQQPTDDLTGALADLGRQLQRADARHATLNRARRRGVFAGAAVSLLLLTLTPPGRALADRVGELVGIGSEPSTPEVRIGYSMNSIVIGTGEAPDGSPFEVVATHAFRGEARRAESTDDCVGLSRLEGLKRFRTCLTPEFHHEIETTPLPFGFLPRIGAPEVTGERALLVSGIGSADVTRIEVSYEAPGGERRKAEVPVYRLDQELADRIGAAVPFVYYHGFLPTSGLDRTDPEAIAALLGSLELIALDRAGVVIGHQTPPRIGPPPKIASKGSDRRDRPRANRDEIRILGGQG